MIRTLLLLAAACIVLNAGAPYCDAPQDIQAELQKAADFWDRPGSKKSFDDGRKAIVTALLKTYPDDIQVNRAFQNDGGETKAELRKRYRVRLDSDPQRALLMYFYALTLIGHDTLEAMRLLETSIEKDKDLAWPHLALVNIHLSRKYKDAAKAASHIEAFFSLCPETKDRYPLRIVASAGSPELQRKVAGSLRERLESSGDAGLARVYESLWNLEFKVTPPAEHEGVRERIKADAIRLRKLFPNPEIANLRLIRQAYEQAGDKAAVTAVNDDILRTKPESHDAADITLNRWNAQNPYPKLSTTDDAKQAYQKMLYELSGKWIRQWPWHAVMRVTYFNAARGIKDLPPEQMLEAGYGTASFLEANPVLWTSPPFAHQAAQEFIDRRIYPERVLELVRMGSEEVYKRATEREASDLDPEEYVKMSNRNVRMTELSAIELLARAFTQLKQAGKATELRSRWNAVPPAGDEEKVAKMRVASRIAELESRKMDAFTFLEKSIAMMPHSSSDFAKRREDELRTELRRLWTDLGGSEETWILRQESRSQVQEAKAGTGWKEPEKPLPSFDLPDLDGKRWQTASFAGKTLLINVWATWCGPCRSEHPHLQKLYEKLKDRKDVAIITFNVDDQIGMVQPYMAEQKLTFPVLFAGPFVNDIFSGFSIPRNWLLDAKGTHKYEQIGFGESEQWESNFLNQINLLAGTN